jgi:hypothetical protein
MKPGTDSLREDVANLARPGGRPVGSAGHERALNYLLERMTHLRLEPYTHDGLALPYARGGMNFTNLIGRIPGRDLSLPSLLLGAHYDTAGPYPGADDNAAAVAILLALVPFLQESELERSVIIALFDAEEPPYFHTASMGSTVFHEQQRQEEIHSAIIMDLVGHDVPVPGFSNLMFITGMESNEGWVPLIQQAARTPDLKVIASLNRYVGDMSDHHVFRLNRRPYLFLSCGRWQHYHQPTDTPEKLNYDKMAAVAALLFTLTRQAASIPLDAPFEGYDSTPYECETIRGALGLAAPLLGFTGKCDREAIDRFAQHILSTGL